MLNGKHKMLTFSFDDAVTQDKRAIEILDAYGLKATFNLASGLFGTRDSFVNSGKEVHRVKFIETDIKEVYKNHEVAGHTVTHRRLPELSDEEIIKEVEDNRRLLESLVGYDIKGMAYPCGGENNNDRVAKIIRENTPLKYARTIKSTFSFDRQENLLRFNPTVYIAETEKMFELAEQFINLETDKDQIFYIWGHTYEFDALYFPWQEFERLCKLVSGRSDIYYGTNSEVLL